MPCPGLTRTPARAALLAVLAALAVLGPLAAQYTPPACSGTPMFFDVENSDDFCPWIEQLARDGIVGSCDFGRYCPDAPVTRAQAALLLGKSLREHLWGEGRPGTTIHGESALLLCDDGEGPRYGLSHHAVVWGEAAAACPVGTWVCTKDDRGTAECDTNRDDTICDRWSCDGSCLDDPADAHYGWVADAASGSVSGLTAGEQGLPSFWTMCAPHPVWCCRD